MKKTIGGVILIAAGLITLSCRTNSSTSPADPSLYNNEEGRRISYESYDTVMN